MQVTLTLPMMEDNNDTLLETAIALWEDTEEIPLDMAVELLCRGYDVAGLQKLHQLF